MLGNTMKKTTFLEQKQQEIRAIATTKNCDLSFLNILFKNNETANEIFTKYFKNNKQKMLISEVFAKIENEQKKEIDYITFMRYSLLALHAHKLTIYEIEHQKNKIKMLVKNVANNDLTLCDFVTDFYLIKKE